MMQMMISMQEEMQNMRSDMKNMQTTITQLSAKCEQREINMDDKFNCMNSRFDRGEDKQMYHEVLLKNQKWV